MSLSTKHFRIALATSILINLVFAVRFALFEQRALVRPLCFANHHGLVALDGPQTDLYRDAFREVRSRYDVRLDAEGYYYISLLNYWKHEQLLWNVTTKIVNQLVLEHGDEMTLPPYKIEGPDRGKVTCDLVRAVAIEPSSD